MLYIDIFHLIQYLGLATCAFAANWSTYPAVPKTASINGFADPIMNNLPTCAKSCVSFSVGNTPCPYWDTGCLCVMPQWSGEVAACFVSSCTQATDLASATSAAYYLCSSVGANVWMMPASLSSALQKAASTTSNGASIAATATVTSGFASSTGTANSSKIASQSAAVTSAPISSTRSNNVGSSSSAALSSTLRSSTANAGNTLGDAKNFAAILSVLVLSLLG